MDQEKELQQKLDHSIKALDGIEPPTPDFTHFKALVDRQQALVRRARRVQLALFVAVALAIVSTMVLVSGHVEAFFVIMQAAIAGASVIGLAIYSLHARRQAQGAH